MRPLFARVLIERESLQQKTRILIPETAAKRNAPAIGTVVAVGPTADKSIEVGARVVFGRHAGDEIEVGDKKLWITQDEDILAVIE